MTSGKGPGPTLKATRQAMNVEPREVADALNLPLTTVQAIEENDYAQLPNAVFARGYVRSYAKLLELDPDPIVQQFPMPEQSVSEVTMNVERASPFAFDWRNCQAYRARAATTSGGCRCSVGRFVGRDVVDLAA